MSAARVCLYLDEMIPINLNLAQQCTATRNCVERQHRVTALFTSSRDELIHLKEEHRCFFMKQTISMISFQGSVMMMKA